MSKRIDLSGQRFGKLLVCHYIHTIKNIAFWNCQCDCGKIIEVTSGHLRSNHTQSCGCLQIEMVTKRSNGNTWGRKYLNPQIMSAKHIWKCAYSDGCSFDMFMTLSQLPCYYCGISPSNIFNKYINKSGELTNKKVSVTWAKQAYFTYNGLDRIDSTKNHDENNIVPCCFRCNRAKDDMTMEEFKIWLNRLFNNFKQK